MVFQFKEARILRVLKEKKQIINNIKVKNKEYIKLIFFYKKQKIKNNCNRAKIFAIKPKNDII